MESPERPKLSIVLSLSPSTNHFSDPTPPELSLTIKSNTSRPLTIFSWHTILFPKLALAQRGFIITDLTNGAEVAQTSIHVQHKAFTRLKGSPDEVYYLTIHPNTPNIVSTPFSRAGDLQPLPKAVVEQGWEFDDKGNEVKVRRSVHAQGVDGLEAGHRYRLDVAPAGLRQVWWRWGTRDEVLVDDRESPESMWSRKQSEQQALEFETIDGIEFSVEA